MIQRIVLIFSVVLCGLLGCVRDIKLDNSYPLYVKPTLSLEEKAHFHENFIWDNCVDQDGLMLYVQKFKEVDGIKVPCWEDTSIYNKADFPGWQGQFIVALAFKWAVTGQNLEHEIISALSGLEKCYEATGIPGQLVRAYIKYDGDTLLPWMKSYERARDTDDLKQGWWQKGKNGYWFRNQVAGGHHQGVLAAICILGGLQKQGKIDLSTEAQQRIYDFIEPLYNRIRSNNNKIMDVDGKTTGFGRVFSVVWHLTRARAAAIWGVPGAQEEFDENLGEYASWCKFQYSISVPILVRLPLTWRPLGANDIQWDYQAWLALLVTEGVDANKPMRDIRRGYRHLFRIHNPSNAHNYVIQKIGDPKLNDPELHTRALEAMEWYPVDKFEFIKQEYKITSNKWQPIQNRSITTSYAKNAGFKRGLKGDSNGGIRGDNFLCGFDYIYTYWAARYFNIF